MYFETILSNSYSWDEGEQWSSHQFLSDDRIYVYGLLTEPGEQSAQFTIFGSHSGRHEWIVVQADLRKVLGKICLFSLILA